MLQLSVSSPLFKPIHNSFKTDFCNIAHHDVCTIDFEFFFIFLAGNAEHQTKISFSYQPAHQKRHPLPRLLDHTEHPDYQQQ